jgi:hypothetical protein
VDARAPAKGIDLQAGIAAAWRALMSAFATKLSPSSTGGMMPNADCATGSSPCPPRIASISRSLPGLPVAITTRRAETKGTFTLLTGESASEAR